MTNKLMYFSLKIGTIFARFIPRSIGLRFASFLGYVVGSIPNKLQKRLIKIHKRINPEASNKQLKRRAAQVVASYAQYWWDVLWMSSPRSNYELEQIVDVGAQHHFDDAISKSKESGVGVILALPHMGSWEIAGAWLAVLGHEPVVVAERLEPPELFELFTKTRSDAGMTVIAHDNHPTAKLLSALKQGKAICLVADRDMSHNGVEIEFFGSKKTLPTGPAALALKTGAIILPVCMYLTRSGQIDIIFSKPIKLLPLTDSSMRTEIIKSTTKQLGQVFEMMISKDPTQWHVLSDEWI